MSEVLKDLPKIEQAPIIEYSKLENIGELVKARIDEIGIDLIDATEENLSLLKTTRSSLNNQFKEFEERRKMIKDQIMKPYNDFDKKYKEYVSDNFKIAEDKLKEKVTTVESGLLQSKIDDLVIYFETQNNFSFVKFDQLGLKITRSASDKSIKETIDEKLNQITSDIETINTLQHKERVLAQYQMSLDLNQSISSVNIAIEREKQIAESVKPVEQPKEVKEDIAQNDNKLYKMSFTVNGTIDQLKQLKQFMEEKGIKYE